MPVYWIWFANLKGLSLGQKQQLLQSFGEPEELWQADPRRFPREVAEALEKAMLDSPGNWQKHYHGDEHELWLARRYSFSDRA